VSSVVVTCMIPAFVLSQPASDIEEHVKTHHVRYLITLSFFGFAMIFITSSPFLVRRFSELQLEIIMVFTMMVSSVSVIFLDSHYLAKMLRLGLADERLSMSDSRALLVLGIILTMGHMLIPVRWCTLIPLQVFIILLYSLCVFILGSPDGFENSVSNLMLFLVFSMCTACGKRQLECYERMSCAHSSTLLPSAARLTSSLDDGCFGSRKRELI